MAGKTIIYTSSQIDENTVMYQNSMGGKVITTDPLEVADFLAYNYPEYVNRKMFWNLDLGITPFLKMAGNDVCTDLVTPPLCASMFYINGNGVQTEKITADPTSLPTGAFFMRYNRKTLVYLKSSKQKYPSYFYNLSQYFKDIDPWDEHNSDLAWIEQGAEEVIDAFIKLNLVKADKSGGFNAIRLASAVSGFEETQMEHMDVPTIGDIPGTISDEDADELVMWAESIMNDKVLITNYAVGCWADGETFDYDLQSAYGYELSQIAHYGRGATWWKSNTAIKEANEGLLKGRVTINPDVKMSPISHRTENGNLIYPVGSTWETILTLSEVRWIYRHKIGTFELDYGYFWKYCNVPIKPFEKAMQRVFDARKHGGVVKDVVKDVAKMVGANAWGKLIQSATNTGERTKWYSPLVALQVKTNCCLRVADFIYDNNLQDNIIHIATDGVRVNRHIDIPEKTELGQWKESGHDACMLLSPGNVLTATHHPHGLYMDEAIELMKAKPRDMYYQKSLFRPLTLAEALERGNLDLVGEIADVPTSIDLVLLRQSQDLDYPDFPRTGKELIENKYFGRAYRI